MRTLVIHTGGLGDFLLACPAIAHLAQAGPVVLAGNRERLDLAVAGRIAEKAVSLEEIDFGSAFSVPSERFKRALAGYERAVIWMRDTGEIACVFREAGIPEVRCFPGLPPEGWTRHASEYFLECVGAPPAPPFRLTMPAVSPPLDIVIHPGSGSARKNWPLDRFEALSRSLIQQGRPVTWCAGPAEKLDSVALAWPCLRVESLPALAERLAQAMLYIGNDSGITHLAAAVGCPTVGLFGPTDPAIWAPRGRHVHILRRTPWPEAPEVIMLVEQLLASEYAGNGPAGS